MAPQPDRIDYDLCIVGAGMIGSAAARHASNTQGVRVCLIGVPEPQDRSTARIFASHNDVSRITRSLDPDPFWAVAARKSIARYRQIEQESGIKFYEESGCLILGNRSTVDGHMKSARAVRGAHPGMEVLSAEEGRVKFPYLGIEPSHHMAHEYRDAGYINPRELVRAQKQLARKQGCDIITEEVTDVTRESQSGASSYSVRCSSGHVVRARKVLLCTGAHSKFSKLLPGHAKPELTVRTQVVMFVPVPEKDVETFRSMPSLGYSSANDNPSYGAQFAKRCYVLPPIKYPDGKYYIKIGHGDQFEHELKTNEDIINWYRNPAPLNYRDGMKPIFSNVFPGVPVDNVFYDTCVTTTTHNRRPFLDLIGPNFGVALGGNGYAATSSDEIGRIAAQLVLNNVWDCAIPTKEFKMKLATASKL